MSPKGIDQRLRDLAQLYHLGMTLHGAELLGSVEELRRGRDSQAAGPARTALDP